METKNCKKTARYIVSGEKNPKRQSDPFNAAISSVIWTFIGREGGIRLRKTTKRQTITGAIRTSSIAAMWYSRIPSSRTEDGDHDTRACRRASQNAEQEPHGKSRADAERRDTALSTRARLGAESDKTVTPIGGISV